MTLTVLAGCGGKASQTQLMTEAGDVSISARDLRARGNEFAKRFAGVVEVAADSISGLADDPQIKYNALVWKLGAITAVELAIFQPDPLGSFIDTWALTLQMRAYFETGAGKDLFGEWQPIAARASRRLEIDVAVIARGLGTAGDISSIEERVATWAREHPLTSPAFLRESTVPLWKQVGKLSGGLAAVTSMEETLEDLTTRLNVYAVLLPKQARWHSELVLGEYVQAEEMSRFLDNVDRITLAADEIAEFTESFNQLLADERSAALEAVRRERVAVLNSIDEQRVATLEELTAQMAVALKFLHDERVGMMAQMDSLMVAAMNVASPQIKDAIDHFFWRATQFLLGFLAVCAVGGFVLYRMLDSRRRFQAKGEAS